MPTLTNTADCGTDGVQVTTANSGGDCGDAFNAGFVGPEASVVFDSSQSAFDGLSFRFMTGAASDQAFIGWSSSTFVQSFGRTYFRMSDLDEMHTIARFRFFSTQIARITVETSGLFRLRDTGNSTVAESITALVIDTWYLIEWNIVPGNGSTSEVRVSDVNNNHIETINASADFFIGGIDEHHFGEVVAGSNLGPTWFDQIAVNDVSYPGPFIPPPTSRASKYARPLIINEPNPHLDLAAYVGQRSATYRFDLVDGPTNIHIGTVHPLRDSVPALSHDTTRTIKRSLSLELGKSDTAEIDTIRTRVIPFMVFDDGTEYQLGRYMFSDSSKQRFTSGRLSSNALIDEMFIVDQAIQQSYSLGTDATVGFGAQETTIGGSVDEAFDELLDDLNLPRRFEESGKYAVGSWPLGTSRARIIEDLALQGDFFSSWFDNHGIMRLIRVFEPHDKVPDFDFDEMNHVYYSTIAETNDLLSAPNRIIVINNGSTASTVPIVGTYDIPSSAPHSIANRGFIISDVRNMQVSSLAEANTIAANLGIRQNVYERVELSTAPDPRHDSYNVIKWDNERWLELGWTMNLIEGGEMRHIMRKTYS